MDIVYVVEGRILEKGEKKEKEILYAGNSAKRAFEFFRLNDRIKNIEVTIFENGSFVQKLPPVRIV